MLAAESIMLGRGDLLVAGGMENMSAIPYYIPKARFGYKYGNETGTGYWMLMDNSFT